MEKMHSDTWCPLPFLSLTLHPTGQLTHCMMSEHHMGDFDEGWDNYRFVEMRENMLAGKWNLNQDFPDSPPHVDYVKKGGQLTRTADCSNCYNKEMRGLQSQRQNWLRNMVNMLPNGTYESANKTTGNEIGRARV